ENERLTQYQPDHIATVRPESEPNAKLVGPPRYSVRHQAVEPDAGEQHSQQSEEGTQLRNETMIQHRIVHGLVQCREVIDRKVRINGVYRPGNCARGNLTIAGITCDEVVEKSGMLCVWIEGGGRLLFFKALVLGILDYTDDFNVLPIGLVALFSRITGDAEGPAYRRLASKVGSGQRFVDDSYAF